MSNITREITSLGGCSSRGIGADGYNVSEMFDEGFEIFEEIGNKADPNNSGTIQSMIHRSIELLEETTKIISLTGMFSTNESIAEVSSSEMKFFLLPALLGSLTLRLTSSDRMEILNTAEIYFKDFLTRCKNYGIIDYDVPEQTNEVESVTPDDRVLNITNLVQKRNAKIQRFKEKKEFERQIVELKTVMASEVADEDVRRDYNITLIKSYAHNALEELEAIDGEKPMVEHMKRLQKEGSKSAEERKARFGVQQKPLQPIIITRDEVQKKIYGAGYPSLPTMTVNEFYEQRAKVGDFPGGAAPSGPPMPAWLAEEAAAFKADAERAAAENREETDDAETLERARNMDEYKDTHRRGWGNRNNRS